MAGRRLSPFLSSLYGIDVRDMRVFIEGCPAAASARTGVVL
jgi:hypothetical protein